MPLETEKLELFHERFLDEMRNEALTWNTKKKLGKKEHAVSSALFYAITTLSRHNSYSYFS